MGQGFHSKVIYGIVLNDEMSEKFSNLYQTDSGLSDEISNYLGKVGVSQSYEVSPVWIGFAVASTDNVVARMRKIADIEAGIKISEIPAITNSAQLRSAKKVMVKVRDYLKQKGFEVSDSDLYLVTDYH